MGAFSRLFGPDRIVHAHLRQRFLITTHDDLTFDAVLLDADATTLHLTDVKTVSSEGQRVKADGHLLLARDEVAYMQRP